MFDLRQPQNDYPLGNRREYILHYWLIYLMADSSFFLPGTVAEGCGPFSFRRYERLSSIFGLYNATFSNHIPTTSSVR